MNDELDRILGNFGWERGHDPMLGQSKLIEAREKAKAALHRLILKERLKQLGTVSQSQVLDSRCSCCNVNGDALRNRIAQLNAEIEGSNHG